MVHATSALDVVRGGVSRTSLLIWSAFILCNRAEKVQCTLHGGEIDSLAPLRSMYVDPTRERADLVRSLSHLSPPHSTPLLTTHLLLTTCHLLLATCYLLLTPDTTLDEDEYALSSRPTNSPPSRSRASNGSPSTPRYHRLRAALTTTLLEKRLLLALVASLNAELQSYLQSLPNLLVPPETKPKTKPKPKHEPKTNTNTNTKRGPGHKRKPESKVKADPDSEPEPEPRAKTKVKTRASANTALPSSATASLASTKTLLSSRQASTSEAMTHRGGPRVNLRAPPARLTLSVSFGPVGIELERTHLDSSGVKGGGGCSVMLVRSVVERSAAARAGVLPGMALHTVNGRPAAATTVRRLQTRLLGASPTNQVHLKLVAQPDAATYCSPSGVQEQDQTVPQSSTSDGRGAELERTVELQPGRQRGLSRKKQRSKGTR